MALLDHLVGEREQVAGNIDAKRLGGFEVDRNMKFARLYDRQIGGRGALQDTTSIDADLAIAVGKIIPELMRPPAVTNSRTS